MKKIIVLALVLFAVPAMASNAANSTVGCQSCLGDGDLDGYVTLDDLNTLLEAIVPHAPDYWIDSSDPAWNPCFDMDGDGYITLDDLNIMVNLLTSSDWWLYGGQCPNGAV